jgi:hypothetical protein
MNIGRSLSRYLDALAHARGALSHPGVLVPFLAFAFLEGAILLAMASFTAPALSPVMVPVMRFLGGEQSLHYPMSLVGLPAVYQRLYLPLVATVGFPLWSLAAWKLVDHHAVGSGCARRAFWPALSHVILLGVLFVGASVVTGEAASRLLPPRTADPVRQVVLAASVGFTAVLQSFLIYAPFVLRIRGGTALRALAAGASYARRVFLPTVLLIATVLLAHLPVDFLLSRADRIAARFSPETVLHAMAGSVALEMLTAYLLFAGVAELALPREGGLR